MHNLVLLIALCSITLSGCFGVGVDFLGEKNIVNNKGGTSKDDLIRIYGKPNLINKISDKEEILVYNNGLGWGGVMPYVSILIPIPVPILVPTHHNWSEYHISNNIVITETLHYTGNTNYFCGFTPEDEGSLGHPHFLCGRAKEE